MATFVSTKDVEMVAGDVRVTEGTFTSSGGATGGDIITGLQKVYLVIVQQKGSGVVASDAAINETFPCNDPVTIVTAANVTGRWFALGV